MKIIAIVPARAGSKRLPGKNVKLLGGRPLIAWTIEAALASSGLSDVIVTTDDQKTAEIARYHGASVLGLRPAHLATDTATSLDVVMHVLDEYESLHGPVDGVLLLQPTSPFRSTATINDAIRLFGDVRCKAVVSVTAASTHPAWCFKLEQGGMQPFLGWSDVARRSQDLEPAYMLNGGIYLISPAVLREKRSFVFEGVVPLVMDAGMESLDIDTLDDWSEAQKSLQALPTP